MWVLGHTDNNSGPIISYGCFKAHVAQVIPETLFALVTYSGEYRRQGD